MSDNQVHKTKKSILFIVVILLLWLFFGCSKSQKTKRAGNICLSFQCIQGGIVRADTTQKKLTLVFTGDEFADGAEHILEVLAIQKVKAAFFFTGNFYRNAVFADVINRLKSNGHYLGAHSNRHLLYCPWEKRDSLLVTKEEFINDLAGNYAEMARFGIQKNDAPFFLPPYEWYNDSISAWTRQSGLQLINFTSGTRSNADYTTPDMPNYQSSDVIYRSIREYEQNDPAGLNGFLLLVHIGTAPERTDKFYKRLEELIVDLREKGYEFKSLVEQLNTNSSIVKKE